MERQNTTPRPDVDIDEDISVIVRSYSPLQASREHFSHETHEGVVKFLGNVRNPQARQVLVENTHKIAGVREVDAAHLYDDEAIRLAIGPLLPEDVFAAVTFGVASLTGEAPHTISEHDLADSVGRVPGVRQVELAFDRRRSTG